MTAFLNPAKVAEGTTSRMTGTIQPQLKAIEDGFDYGGRVEGSQQGFGEALWNSSVDNFSENFSEVFFNPFKVLKPGKALIASSKRLGQLASKVEGNTLVQTIRHISSNPYLTEIRRMSKFGGLIEETMEEEVGGLMKWALTTDTDRKEAGFTLDAQIDTVLGLAPSVFALGYGSTALYYAAYAKDMASLKKTMSEQQKQAFNQIMSESRSGEFGRKAHDYIRSVVMDSSLSDADKKALIYSVVGKYQDLLGKDLVQQSAIAGQEAHEQQITEFYQQRSNSTSGNIEHAIIRGDEDNTTSYIRKGKVVYDEDGNIDLGKSDKSCVVVTETTDEKGHTTQQVRQIPTKDIITIVNQGTVAENAADEIRQSNIKFQAEQLFPEGSMVTVPNSDGATSQVHYDTNGNIVIDTDAGQVTFTPEEAIDQLVPVATEENTESAEENNEGEAGADNTVNGEENNETPVEENNEGDETPADDNDHTPAEPQRVTFVGNGTTVTAEVEGDNYYLIDEEGNRTRPFTLQDLQQNGFELQQEQVEPQEPIVTVNEQPAQDTTEEAQAEIDITNPQVVGTNQYGKIYQWVLGKAQEAAKFLRKNRGGYLKGVFHREDIGDIDLAWGNKKAGLLHIIKRHIEEQDDFDSVNEAVEAIEKTIQNGTARKEDNSYVVEHGNTRVVIANDGKGNWVVTAYDYVTSKEKKRKDAAATVTPGQPNVGAGAVAPNLSKGKGTANVSYTQAPKQKSSLSEAAAQAAAKAELQAAQRKAAHTLSKKLGVGVTIINDVNAIPDAKTRASVEAATKQGKRVRGWYNPKTNEVSIFLPGCLSVADIEQTFIHEVVAHKGLRALLGVESFDGLCDEVWKWMDTNLSQSEKEKWLSYPGVKGDTRAAADEYMAAIAEQMRASELESAANTEQSAVHKIWNTMLDYVKQALHKLGIGEHSFRSQQEFNDYIRSLIVDSYANLRNQNLDEQIEKIKAEYPGAVVPIRSFDDNHKPSYEFRSRDAIDISKITNTALSTDKNGVPYIRIDEADFNAILPKLIQAGRRVAIVDGTITDTPIRTLSFENQVKSLKERIPFKSKEEKQRFDDVINNLRADGVSAAEIPLEVIADEQSQVEMFDGGIADYIFEHYPTQAYTSALTDSKQGEKEREAMQKDPVLAKMRQEVYGKQDAVWQKLNEKYDEVKAIVDNPNVTIGEVAKQWSEALAFCRNIETENDIRFSVSATLDTDNTLTDQARREMRAIAEQAKADGTYMQAPNGEPTNLTERQWLQVRTKAFKKWFGDWELAAKAKYLLGNKYVKVLTGTEFQKDETPITKKVAQCYNDRFNGRIERKHFGEVILDERSVKDSIAHGIGRTKSAAFAAVPEIIRDGVEIDTQENWKGRNRDSFTFAAPVEIGGKPYVGVVIVTRGAVKGDNRFYLHEVILQENLQSERIKTDNKADTHNGDIAKVLKNIVSTKENASKVVDSNGEPLVVYHGARTDTQFYAFHNSNNFFIDDKQVAEMFASENAYQLVVDGQTYSLSKSDAEEIVSSIEPYYPNDILQLFDKGMGNILDIITVDKLNDLHDYGSIQCGIDTFDGAKEISIKPAANKLFEVFLNIRNPQIVNFEGKEWEVGDDARLTPQPPHDGLIAKNIIEGGAAAEIDGMAPPAATDFVVQSPNQIKSATNNNGSFDESSDDIRFSIIGERGAANLDHAEEVTARMDNLQVARDMEQDGKDARTIRLATGWERGADHKWRYEIPDVIYSDKWKDKNRTLWDNMSPADRRVLRYYQKFNYEMLSPVQQKNYNKLLDKLGYVIEERLTLKDVLVGRSADKLFAAYPELKNVRFGFERMGYTVKGFWSRKNNKIRLSEDIQFNDQTINSVLNHEIQHAIQDIEGFARGGNIAYMQDLFERALLEKKARSWADALRKKGEEIGEHNNQSAVEEALIDEYKEQGMDMPNEETRTKGFNYFARGYADSSLDEAIKQFKLDEKAGANFDSVNGYMRLAGEVEARNVQKRLELDEWQRRKRLLAETEDVAREDQLFLMGEEMDTLQLSIRHPFGGNSGYYGYSKSVRAVEAEESGKRSISNFDNEFVSKVNDILQSVEAETISIAQAKRLAKEVTPDEWHHTSMYGNKTNYYSPETIARAAMTDEQRARFDAAEEERERKEANALLQEYERKAKEEKERQHQYEVEQKEFVSAAEKVIVSHPEIKPIVAPNGLIAGYWINLDGVHIKTDNALWEQARTYETSVKKGVAKELATQYLETLKGEVKEYMDKHRSESSDDIRFSIASEENERKEQVQQLATDGVLEALSDADAEPILISDEEAEQVFGLQNSGAEFDKSHKSSIFVPTSKVPKEELAVAHKALFAKVQDHAKAGTTYGVFSANYFHIFDGNRHIGAIKIEGNEDTIDYIQKGISNGTYRNTKSIGQWLRAISSGKRYDNRDNANAPRQRGGDVAANALYGGQPTDSQRNQYQSNGDSGNTVPLRTSSGVVFGFVRNGKIYITAHGLNPNTPIHEYTHLWAKALQQKNRKAWQSIVDLLKDTPMWNDVVNDPNYADLQGNDDAIASEVLARYSGKHGAERFEQEAKRVLQNKSIKDYARTRVLIDNVREALNRFWNWVGKDLFHIDHFDSIDEVADRVVYDIVNGTDISSDVQESEDVRFSIAPLTPHEGESISAFAQRNVEYQDSFKVEEQAREYERSLQRSGFVEFMEKADRKIFDAARPLLDFLNEFKKRGAKVTVENDAYSDVFRAGSRSATAIERYQFRCERPLAQAVRKILDSKKLQGLGFVWQNLSQDDLKDKKDRKNGTPISAFDLLGLYLQAKDCKEAVEKELPDRGAAGFETNVCIPTDPAYKDGVSYDKVIEAVESALGEDMINDLWNKVRACTNYALDYQQKRGYIDADTREKYRRDFYVPERGWLERDMSGMEQDYQQGLGKMYNSPYNAALQQAKGRSSLASNPFAYISSIVMSSIITADSNVTNAHLLQFCLDNQELGLQTDAYRIKKFWTIRALNEDGSVSPDISVSFAQPTERMYEHDKEVHKKIDAVNKQIAEVNKQMSAWKSVAKTGGGRRFKPY